MGERWKKRRSSTSLGRELLFVIIGFFFPSLPLLSSLPSELPRGIAGRPSAVGSQSIEPRLKPCSRSRRENSLAQTPFTCAAEHSRGRQGLLRPASYTTRSASAIERLKEQRSERLTGGPWALLEHTIVTDTAHLCRTVAQVVQEANGQSHLAVLYVRCSEGDEDDARNVHFRLPSGTDVRWLAPSQVFQRLCPAAVPGLLVRLRATGLFYRQYRPKTR